MIYDYPEDFLAHHGVKGMRWGVRKQRTPGVSRKTDRAARKDAKEFTQAKMYYGEGAQMAGVIPPTADIARKAAKAGRTGYDAVVNSGAMRRMMHEINIYNGRRAFNKQFG